MPAVPRGPFYRLQVGSFLEVKNAVNTLNRLRTAGFSPYYERYGNYYRVVILGVRAADVQGMVSRLGTIGFQEVLVRGQY
jgi:cell division protein FtsN